MRIVANIGNSQCHFAVFDKDRITERKNCPTSQWNSEFLREFDQMAIDEAVIVSVVQQPTKDIHAYFAARNIAAAIVGEGGDYGIACRSPELTENLGADRAMNILGGLHIATPPFTGPPFIVIDCGTATTVDYCDEKGRFAGGIIAPGVRMMADSLHYHTDKLPLLQEIAPPPQVLGQNTTESMLSAVTFGYAAMLDGLIRRISPENPAPQVILCGGFAPIIAPCLNCDFILQNDLTLWGGWCYMEARTS